MHDAMHEQRNRPSQRIDLVGLCSLARRWFMGGQLLLQQHQDWLGQPPTLIVSVQRVYKVIFNTDQPWFECQFYGGYTKEMVQTRTSSAA